MRMNAQKELFNNNSLVNLKDKNWLEKQRVAGKVVAGALSFLQAQVEMNTQLSMIELNALTEEFILDHACDLTFKNYKGFPAGVCISINKQLVHGIPTDYHLQEGDLVSFDLGATYQGAIADSAISCIYGTPKSEKYVKLLNATEDALMAGIAAVKVGNRIGDIGSAIYNFLKHDYGVITQYGGHGIDTAKDGSGIPHAAPFVANKSNVNEGIRIQKGLVIAIEPMAVIGDTKTFVDKDGWTVWGMGISAHFEHSVYVHDDHVEIVTAR